MKKILVPLDFSEYSRAALLIAFDLAKKLNATVELFHVLEPVLYSTHVEKNTDWSTRIDNDSNSVHQKMAKFSELLGGEISVQTTITDKSPLRHVYKCILEKAKEGLFNYIIMGTSGDLSDFEESFIGSNAQKVVQLSGIPVLVVKADQNPGFKNILYVSDFKDNEKNKNIEKLIEFAKVFKAKIHLLFINTPIQFEATQTSLQRLEKIKMRYMPYPIEVHIYNEFTPEYGVNQFCQQNEVDLISISTHGYRGLNHFFNISTTENLVHDSKLPILSFKM